MSIDDCAGGRIGCGEEAPIERGAEQMPLTSLVPEYTLPLRKGRQARAMPSPVRNAILSPREMTQWPLRASDVATEGGTHGHRTATTTAACRTGSSGIAADPP
jgi:hypothetical protein